jgi:chromosomal replication initiation ATPase DnaA
MNNLPYIEMNEELTSIKKNLRDYSNPIFISGKAGMGKTRLISEISKWYLEHFPKDRILDFKTELSISNFKRESVFFNDILLYHQILIIDNFAFFISLVTKEKAMHLINKAVNSNLKIIIASSSIVKLDLNSLNFKSYLHYELRAPSKHVLIQFLRNGFGEIGEIPYLEELLEWFVINVPKKAF